MPGVADSGEGRWLCAARIAVEASRAYFLEGGSSLSIRTICVEVSEIARSQVCFCLVSALRLESIMKSLAIYYKGHYKL